MSSRKIIFIVIAILLLLSGVFALWKISTSKELAKTEKVDSLSIWVVWGTTEQYNTLFSGFGDYKKEYAKTKLDIRVFPDYDQYRRILLSTLADGWGPDIFMVDAGADDILEKKLEPIPEDIINFSNFEKDYEDIFLSLITSTGSWDKKKQYINGIPLGYETLGMFYNKSLLLSVPKTWNEVSAMYANDALPNVFPTNIGMGSRFTPFSTDIIASFLLSTGIQS
jgi:ABC-type glycerol-3-phosphate transport system substrate-binding protein